MSTNCRKCGNALSLTSEVNQICFVCAKKSRDQKPRDIYICITDEANEEHDIPAQAFVIEESEYLEMGKGFREKHWIHVREVLPSDLSEISELDHCFAMAELAQENADKWRGIAERMYAKLTCECVYICLCWQDAKREYEKECK